MQHAAEQLEGSGIRIFGDHGHPTAERPKFERSG